MPTDANAELGWSWVFHMKGGSGARTRLWSAWDRESRAAVLTGMRLYREELPVVMARPTATKAILLTTRRLFCDGRVVPVNHIVNVEPVQGFQTSRRLLNGLSIGLASGHSFRIFVESGPSSFALWNVLAYISKRNRRRRLIRRLTRPLRIVRS